MDASGEEEEEPSSGTNPFVDEENPFNDDHDFISPPPPAPGVAINENGYHFEDEEEQNEMADTLSPLPTAIPMINEDPLGGSNLRDGIVSSSASSMTMTPSPCPTTIVVENNTQHEVKSTSPYQQDIQENITVSAGQEFQQHSLRATPTGASISACNTPIPQRDTPCSSSRFSTIAGAISPSIIPGVSGTRITLNPLFESASKSASFVKKKIMTRLKSLRGEEPEEEEANDETKSLSIDSYYITPANEREAAEKLIQATNYFIVSALIAAFILGILVLWLLAGNFIQLFS